MNSHSYLKIVVVTCLSLFLISCGVSLIKGEEWLSSKKDKPAFNVSGSWVSPEWGIAIFKQEGKDISGMLGDYPVKGVASGNTLYLLMYYEEKVYYMAELIASAPDMNTFKGEYSSGYHIDEVKDDPAFKERIHNVIRPITLQRVLPASQSN